MAQIFLFTKAAKVGNETRKMLRENGIVPVEVETLDAVKLLDVSAYEVSSGVVLRAAMRAFQRSSKGGAAINGLTATRYFAEELSAALANEPQS